MVSNYQEYLDSVLKDVAAEILAMPNDELQQKLAEFEDSELANTLLYSGMFDDE